MWNKCVTNRTFKTVSFMEINNFYSAHFTWNRVIFWTRKKRNLTKNIKILVNSIFYMRLKIPTNRVLFYAGKMILHFQTKHTKPLITTRKHDHFTACGKMPTAFERNKFFSLMKVFFLFSSRFMGLHKLCRFYQK